MIKTSRTPRKTGYHSTEGDSSLNTEIYQKPTINSESHHPVEHKLRVIRSLHNYTENVPSKVKEKGTHTLTEYF